ncbi:MAG: hypothetical protein RIE77_10905 [Phycisphaerales bacterium]|jgi:hypothetical protein
MPRTPQSDTQFVTWASDHVAVWAGNGTPPDIGLTTEQVAAAQLLVDDAEEKLDAQRAARDAAKAATAEKDTSVDALRASIGGLIGIIDGYAKNTADPDVYARAQIDAPRPAAPRTDAPTPTDVQASLLNDGTVEFRFRVASGGGAVYLVQRQTVSATGEEGQFENVGQADDLKRYFDASVPTGVRSVSYRARTRLTNGELSDWSETATVRFGTAGGTGSATSTGPATGDSKAA